MFNINNRSYAITVTRGDSANLTVTFTGEVIPETSEVLVTVEDPDVKYRPLWEETVTPVNNTIYLELTDEHTDFMPKTYMWDIRIKYSSGKVYTPIPPVPLRDHGACWEDRMKEYRFYANHVTEHEAKIENTENKVVFKAKHMTEQEVNIAFTKSSFRFNAEFATEYAVNIPCV